MDKTKTENFIELLGVENLEKLKSGMVDLLLERFKEDLDNYSYYLIEIDEFVEIIEKEVKRRVQEIMVEKYTKVVEEKVDETLGGLFNDKRRKSKQI